MDNNDIKVIFWIIVFLAMACYLYFTCRPGIQPRTTREIEREDQFLSLWEEIDNKRQDEDGFAIGRSTTI